MTRPSFNFWRSELLADQDGLIHAMTLRDANMALSVGSDIGGTTERRRLACDALSVPFDRLTSGHQVHGTRIAVVTGPLVGRGRDRSTRRIPETDGLVTNERNVPLMVIGADCALIAVYDPTKHAIGVAHSGWRGTAAGMPEALVASLSKTYGSRPADLLAAISPCAGPCCYEVGDDVVTAFHRRDRGSPAALSRRNGTWYLDLAGAVERGLQTAGLQPHHVDRANHCTICNTDCFSYRREGRAVGQSALIAALA